MPQENPLLAEVWEMQDSEGRHIRGIVADITETIITMVSFTGARLRCSPSRLLSTWRFAQSPPNTALQCVRRGCTQAGILRYQRGVSPEWVCPRHLPVGIIATLTSESTRSMESPQVQSEPMTCPRCQSDSFVEDGRVGVMGLYGLWTCQRCSTRQGICFESPDGAGETYLRVLRDFSAQINSFQSSIGSAQVRPDVYNLLYDATQADPEPAMRLLAPLSLHGFPLRRDSTLSTRGRDGSQVNHGIMAMTFEVTRPLLAPLAQPMPAQRIGGSPGRDSNLDRLRNEVASTRQARLQAARQDILADSGMAADLRAMHSIDVQAEAPQPEPAVDIAIQRDRTGAATGFVHVPGYGTVPREPRPEVSLYAVTEPEFVGRFPPRQDLPVVGLPIPTPTTDSFVTVNSVWTNGVSGEVVVVSATHMTDDGSCTAVHFKRQSEMPYGSSQVLILDDFLAMFKMFSSKATVVEPPTVEILQEQEWINGSTQEVVIVDALDQKRGLVTVRTTEGKRRSVPFSQFANGSWKRLIRRTAFERLMDSDDY